jgi:hypothetical protein
MELPTKNHSAPQPRSIPRPRSRPKQSPLFTVKGLLVTVDKEDGDAYTGLALITADEREYHLLGEARLADLARHVDAYAIVWGRVERGSSGERVLRVSNFQVVHWSEE